MSPITRRLQAFKAPKLQVGGRRRLSLPKNPMMTGKALGIGPASAFWIIRALNRDMNQRTMQNLMREIDQNASDEQIDALLTQLNSLQGGSRP